jgi:acylglycerol lipase
MSDAASLTESAVIATESTHRANDGCKLFVYGWSSREADTSSGAVVVVLHGYAEHCGRYREVAEFLVRAGHPVTGFDARGHGRSPGQRGHIENFERYVDDLHGFVTATRQQHPNRPLLVLGHSNGGLTALRMVQTRPGSADSLVLTCPLVALQESQKAVPMWLASILSAVVGRLPVPNGLKPTDLTHDPAILEIQQRDPLNHKLTTPRWYVSTTHAMAQAMANLSAVRLPVLVVEADSDPIVLPAGVTRMYEGLASTDKELVVCANAFHEVLNEVGRERTYQKIGAWIAAHDKLAR